MNFTEAFQADLRILERPRKTDKLLDRSRQLTHDIRQRHHHTQRHLSIYYSFCRNKGNHNIGSLIKEYGTHLLNLSQCQTFYANFEQFHLYTFPLPAFLSLTVI